jgi:hypothetical protein
VTGTLVLSGCSTKPQIEFTPSANRPTVTVTVTTTVTAPLTTASGTVTTEPGTVTTTAPVTGSQPTTTTHFVRNLAEQGYANLLADITILDSQFATSASPTLRLEVLRQHFATLAGLGVPPGLDGPSYLSRLRTLETFAAAAAEEAMRDRARSAARYAVIRTETGQLLSQVNAVLRTTYTLPVTTPTPTTSAATTSRPLS